MKIRRFLSVFLLTLLLTGLFCVPQASAVEMPQVNAKAALLMDSKSSISTPTAGESTAMTTTIRIYSRPARRQAAGTA